MRKRASCLIRLFKKPIAIALLSLFSVHSHATMHKQDVKCLAIAMHKEARGEGREGMLLVGNVVLNRANKHKNGVCSVVYEKGQFSWAKGKKERHTISKASLDLSRWLLVQEEVGKRVDTAKGATFFHNKHVRPMWTRRMQLVKRYKGHLFYKEK